MITANAEMITTIITGGVTIVAAIIAFAASCKNGNNVTRQSKSALQLVRGVLALISLSRKAHQCSCDF